MNERYYKMDLHIHTPSSSCYEGSKEDEEYINILKTALTKELDIIAITDHNTIKGYEKLLEIKRNLIIEKKILEKYKDDGKKINTDLEEIISKLNLFNSITILPGVEFTINPGIHVIVISDENNINDLKTLLEQLGYKSEHFGMENSILPQMDAREFLQNSFLENKLVIAPHVDSTNGLFNEISGIYRADSFKNDNLCAITCNSPKQLKNIKNLVMNDPNYKRNKPLAFINASDAHCLEAIGSKISYIKLNNPTFDDIHKGFLIPAQAISDSNNPRLKSIINNIISSERTMLIEDIDSKDIEYVAKLVCAFFNDSYRYLILGVVKSKELMLNGIKMTNDDINNIIKSAIDLLNSNTKIYPLKINIEQLGSGRNICIISYRGYSKSLWYLKGSDDVYIYKDKLIKANIAEVEKIVKGNLLNDLKRYENDILFDSIVKNVQLLKSPIDKYQLMEIIYDSGITINNIFELEIIKRSVNTKYWNKKIIKNGNSTGNVFYSQPQSVRLNYAVLRYSCPRMCDDPINISEHLKKHQGYKIVITEKGGVYIIDEDEWYIESLESGLLLLDILKEYKSEFSIYSIAAWLKSSVFIWFINRKCNNTDLYNPKVFNSIIVPPKDILKKGGEVEILVKEIINNEKEFLNNYNELEKNNECDEHEEINEEVAITELDEYEKVIVNHNNTVEKMARKIDEKFFEYYGLTDEQIKTISEDLKMSGIYNIIE